MYKYMKPKKERIVIGQKNINKVILEILDTSKKYIFWVSMLSTFNCNKLISSINNAKDKNVKFSIFHSNNPYFNSTKSDNIRIFPMYGNAINLRKKA